jgi:lipopolysaccharide transport system ATP-binding protein
MVEKAIRVQGLGKEYQIGTRERGYTTFRDALMNACAAPFRRLRQLSGSAEKDSSFWALKDVSFDVEPGEVVGIIGRNGAGKSTLLKLLSQITEPTTGEITLNGRVASLLEVGTGFHPELTGRENIYLNGSILGMSRVEINKKFDEIVAFAEVDKFLDTPVKRYSSGMYVRLAFAVAAHLEPEILIIDEVLAVGDAAFQKKCLGKMGEVAKCGRTVLFVSHNMGAINRLCNKGIVLESGTVAFNGGPSEAIDRYNRATQQIDSRPNHVLFAAQNSGQSLSRVQVTCVEVLTPDGIPKDSIRTWDSLIVRVHGRCSEVIDHAAVELEINSAAGDRMLHLSSQPDSNYPINLPKGRWIVDCCVDEWPLAAGEYTLGVNVTRPSIEYLWLGRDLAQFSVLPNDVFSSGMPPTFMRAPFVARHNWKMSKTMEELEAEPRSLARAGC